MTQIKFFADKFGSINNNNSSKTTSYEVEIGECDDVKVYVETLRLMYCRDLRRKLMREDVSKVLNVLKVQFVTWALR